MTEQLNKPLTTPDHIIAATPHLLGHQPTESLILLVCDTDGTLIVAVRADLPTPHSNEPWSEELHHQLAGLLRENPHNVRILLYTDTETDADAMITLGIATLVITQLGAHVEDSLLVSHGTWARGPWQPDADGPHPLDPTALEDVTHTFGKPPTHTRDDLIRTYAPNTTRAHTLNKLLAQHTPTDYTSTDAINTTVDHLLHTLTQPQQPHDHDKAQILHAITHIRIRDTLIHDLLRSTTPHREYALTHITTLIREAPTGYIAPISCLGAALHFSTGDGISINACLDRALEDNPNYTLAQLMRAVYHSGRNPRLWVDEVCTIDRATMLGATT